MTPKMRVSCIPNTISDDKIMEEIQTKNYSRIPVYSGDVDNIIGISYTREFLLNRELPWFELSQILKPPMFVSKNSHPKYCARSSKKSLFTKRRKSTDITDKW